MAKLRELAAEFEAILVGQLLATMRGPGLKGGVFPEAPGREIYQGLMDQEIAKAVSRSGGIGLADMLVRELSRHGLPGAGGSSPGGRRPIMTGETSRASDGGAR
jgi:Rod binding domain-containing protein